MSKVVIFSILISLSLSANNSRLKEQYKTRVLQNRVAYIPSMCYTKTEDKSKDIHNPCYACHTKSLKPNYINDEDLQKSYSFPLYARENHWKNLFLNRHKAIQKISDKKIEIYINKSNYFDKNHEIILEKKLKNLPASWDIFDNNHWYGDTPNAYFNFDKQGFDINPKTKKSTGWRAFAYTPFLGTFWATNGSTDDVLIRLDKIFMQDSDGLFNKTIYRINLAIVEALILQRNVYIEPVDESLLDYDLNHNGKLDTSNKVVFLKENKKMSYVGLAQKKLQENKIHLERGLFPERTAFLHSVRYIDFDKKGNLTLSKRMKELRYAIKKYWVSSEKLKEKAEIEAFEKKTYPEHLRQFSGNIQIGLDNKQGWYYQGFIEDSKGDLRPQTYEETVYCMGCHSGLGVTTDGIFAFARKISQQGTFQNGWFYAPHHPKKKIAEALRRDGKYEYEFYLQANHAGDEFRANEELKNKVFLKDNKLNNLFIKSVHRDIGQLIIPSKKRALLLNKSYLTLVKEQGFILGREASIEPLDTVHKKLDENQTTHIEKILSAQ